METRHYRTIQASMSHIERLIREINYSLNKKEKNIFNPIKIDLNN